MCICGKGRPYTKNPSSIWQTILKNLENTFKQRSDLQRFHGNVVVYLQFDQVSVKHLWWWQTFPNRNLYDNIFSHMSMSLLFWNTSCVSLVSWNPNNFLYLHHMVLVNVKLDVSVYNRITFKCNRRIWVFFHRIGTTEISFGCQPSRRTSGLVWDNQNLLLLFGMLAQLKLLRNIFYREIERKLHLLQYCLSWWFLCSFQVIATLSAQKVIWTSLHCGTFKKFLMERIVGFSNYHINIDALFSPCIVDNNNHWQHWSEKFHSEHYDFVRFPPGINLLLYVLHMLP